jgi:class 3 adenylate cyclase
LLIYNRIESQVQFPLSVSESENGMEDRKILALLFADIKGYSSLEDDNLYSQLSHILEDGIIKRNLQRGVHLLKTMGDGFILYSSTYAPLAETALRIRDEFRNTDWIGHLFPQNLQLRSALHFDEVPVILHEDGSVKDIVGMGMIGTARIEPQTPPNHVYCSVDFYQQLAKRLPSNIKAFAKGIMPLAKNYGEMELFELLWQSEPNPQDPNSTRKQTSIPMPDIKYPFSDKARKDYLYAAFEQIQVYFEEATNQLATQNATFEATFRRIHNTKFICEIYRDGKLVNASTVWIGGMMGKYEQIQFAEGQARIDRDGGYNDALVVSERNNELVLNATLGKASFIPNYTIKDFMTPDDAAEYLWRRVTAHIGNR